jgi:dTDP-glucose 4,6-dehydratase
MAFRSMLVTGGAGFIGSNFVRLIAREQPECKITVLDALTYAGNMENIGDL